jgi:hypothetical protein
LIHIVYIVYIVYICLHSVRCFFVNTHISLSSLASSILLPLNPFRSTLLIPNNKKGMTIALLPAPPPLNADGQRLGKHVPYATSEHKTAAGRGISCAVRIASHTQHVVKGVTVSAASCSVARHFLGLISLVRCSHSWPVSALRHLEEKGCTSGDLQPFFPHAACPLNLVIKCHMSRCVQRN